MADLVITRRIQKNGLLFDADTPPVLSDPDNTFGLKRVDTGEVVVASGAVLAKQVTGVYSRTFTGLDPGVTYACWIETTVRGNTTRQEKTYTTPLVAATSPGLEN